MTIPLVYTFDDDEDTPSPQQIVITKEQQNMLNSSECPWETKGDPIQDLINAKKMLDDAAENETWERDLWVTENEKRYLNDTPQGQRVMKYLEMATGYKLTLRTPREIGAVIFETELIMNAKSLFKPLPTYERLIGTR
jgi:hypothetical protein